MAVGVQVVVRRQDVFAVSVSVYVAQPVGQAVWQGICVVVVGVLRQRRLGPGMVVVVKWRQRGTMHTLVNVGQRVFDVDVVAV